MYLPGKILYVGGGRTTATAETIDLNVTPAVWRWTGSMAYPRRHLNATMLPTGEVLVTGGTSGTSFNETSMGVRVAEIWNPATGTWAQLASNAVNRGYHATSLLLPDGRVLHTGSGDALDENGNPYPDEKNGELFSPPYLFKGARPDHHERARRAVLRRDHHGEDAECGRDHPGEPHLHRLGDPRLRHQPAFHVAHLHPAPAPR